MTVIHASGEELEKIYLRADASLVAFKNHPYHRFSLPIKLFEAISFGTPVIVSSGLEDASNFVTENKLGYVINSPEELKEIIFKIKTKNSCYLQVIESIQKLKPKITWSKKAALVAHELRKEGKQ